MAIQEKREIYSDATIDCSDMTLTEFGAASVRTYDIMDILKRWNGVRNIQIEIRQKTILPDGEGEDYREP